VQGDTASFPLNTFEPAFAELSDAVADLEANMMHFQIMHESLARFSESFASFLYGLNMNAFCVDFPEVGGYQESKEWWLWLTGVCSAGAHGGVV
jgi:DASH complex subunit DAM1